MEVKRAVRYEKNRKIMGMDELQFRKFLRFLALPGAALALIVLILIADLPKRRAAARESSAVAESLEQAESSETEESAAETEPYDYANAAPERCAEEEVNALVSDFLRARVSGDADEMFRVFGITDQTGLEALRQSMSEERKLYESFENTVNYIIPGIGEQSWIVYISTQAWFRKIETPAPMLMRAYIVRGEDGSCHMKEESTLTEAAADASEAVRRMSSAQRSELAKAVVSDAKLGSLYERLRVGATEAETVAEESSEAAEIEDAVVEIGGASSAAEESGGTEQVSESTEESAAGTETDAAAESAAESQENSAESESAERTAQ